MVMAVTTTLSQEDLATGSAPSPVIRRGVAIPPREWWFEPAFAMLTGYASPHFRRPGWLTYRFTCKLTWSQRYPGNGHGVKRCLWDRWGAFVPWRG